MTQQRHEAFGAALSTALTHYLRSEVVATLQSVGNQPLRAALEDPSDAFIAASFPLRGSQACGIIQIDVNTIIAIIQRIAGSHTPAASQPKSLNALERRLAERIIKRILDVYRRSVRDHLDVDTKLEPLLSINLEDIHLCAKYQLRLLGSYGFLNVCVPE